MSHCATLRGTLHSSEGCQIAYLQVVASVILRGLTHFGIFKLTLIIETLMIVTLMKKTKMVPSVKMDLHL